LPNPKLVQKVKKSDSEEKNQEKFIDENTLIINLFLKGSSCKLNNDSKVFIMKTIGTKFLVTTLIYSGSVHGWLYADFHKYCDGKSPTITLY
jgi:hypothetical protein